MQEKMMRRAGISRANTVLHHSCLQLIYCMTEDARTPVEYMQLTGEGENYSIQVT